uniref:WD repeat domain 49 n=1 Tax=Ornithorhynchus anatinus TaxID=9258 RepID=A0A6I8NSC3_ORNAN
MCQMTWFYWILPSTDSSALHTVNAQYSHLIDCSSCEEEEQQPSLEEKLQLAHLEELEKLFVPSPGRLPEAEGSAARRESLGAKPRPEQMPHPERSLTVRELQGVLCELLGSERWKTQVELLVKKIALAHTGYVTWNELCCHLLFQFQEHDEADRPLQDPLLRRPPLIRRCPQNRQEPTTRVLALPHPPPLQFVSVSRGGVLSVWDSRFRLQKTYKIAAVVNDLTTERSQMKAWITDAAYLPNVHKVAVATTGRKIHFLEMSPTSFFEEFHLFGLNGIPTCLCYCHKSEDGCSLLLWGDDHGGVNVLWFLHPLSGLINKSLLERSGLSGIFMQDISEHSHFLSYYYLSAVHPEAISQIQHLPEDQCITSSGSSETSVVIMDLWKKRTAYTWKIKKGVRCFDYCKPLSLLATGGSDCTVRLWNRYVPGWPTAILRGHSGAVLGVAILQIRDQLLSFSKDGVSLPDGLGPRGPAWPLCGPLLAPRGLLRGRQGESSCYSTELLRGRCRGSSLLPHRGSARRRQGESPSLPLTGLARGS